MYRFNGNLNENFELNIQEEPDYAFQHDSKDDTLINMSKMRYQNQAERFS